MVALQHTYDRLERLREAAREVCPDPIDYLAIVSALAVIMKVARPDDIEIRLDVSSKYVREACKKIAEEPLRSLADSTWNRYESPVPARRISAHESTLPVDDTAKEGTPSFDEIVPRVLELSSSKGFTPTLQLVKTSVKGDRPQVILARRLLILIGKDVYNMSFDQIGGRFRRPARAINMIYCAAITDVQSSSNLRKIALGLCTHINRPVPDKWSW
jgi:hypothetical protein